MEAPRKKRQCELQSLSDRLRQPSVFCSRDARAMTFEKIPPLGPPTRAVGVDDL